MKSEPSPVADGQWTEIGVRQLAQELWGVDYLYHHRPLDFAVAFARKLGVIPEDST